ncbi:hypothetical protein GIB67_007775, partial [Kingdonia uniflora]
MSCCLNQQFKTMAKLFDAIDERFENFDWFIDVFTTAALYAPPPQPTPLGWAILPFSYDDYPQVRSTIT